MPSILALNMRTALLSGSYTAVTFETALATATNAAAFTELVNIYTSSEMLVNSTTAFPVIIGSSTARTISSNGQAFLRACANSGYATEQLVTTANGAALFGIVLRDNSGSRFRHWRDYTANYNRIKGFVNKSGSKLKSQVFTSTAVWSPTFPLQAMSIFGVGGGSSGYRDTLGGVGGGGGEIECINIDQGSLPSVNQTVTIGSGGVFASPQGVATTVGSLFTASGGILNFAPVGGVGGGSTTNGGYINFTDWENPLTAAFQCFSASQQGGNGGAAVNAILGLPGKDGLPGSGGNPSYGTTSGEQAAGGRAYGGGGGSAGGTSTTSGAADANTGGGGGGSDGAAAVAANGGSGIAVIYWLEA